MTVQGLRRRTTYDEAVQDMLRKKPVRDPFDAKYKPTKIYTSPEVQALLADAWNGLNVEKYRDMQVYEAEFQRMAREQAEDVHMSVEEQRIFDRRRRSRAAPSTRSSASSGTSTPLASTFVLSPSTPSVTPGDPEAARAAGARPMARPAVPKLPEPKAPPEAKAPASARSASIRPAGRVAELQRPAPAQTPHAAAASAIAPAAAEGPAAAAVGPQHFDLEAQELLREFQSQEEAKRARGAASRAAAASLVGGSLEKAARDDPVTQMVQP